MRNPIIGIVYLAIVIICVSVSGYTTYVGSHSMFGGALLAGMFAALVGLCLFGADIMIRDKLLAGGKPVISVIFLFAAIGASSLSHFNYFFTTFEGAEIARTAYREEFVRFEQNMAIARTAVGAERDYSEHAILAAYVESEATKLRDQMLDPENKGVGAEALVYVNNIKRTLGSSLTDINLPAPTERDDKVLIAWYDNFMRVARAAVALKASARVRDGDALLATMQARRDEFATFLRRINDAEDNVPRESVTQKIQAMADYSSEVETSLLARGHAQPEFERIVTGTSRTGEITFSLSRVGGGQGLDVALLAIGLSLFIDLAPLGFAIALTSGRGADMGMSGSGSGSGPRVYRR